MATLKDVAQLAGVTVTTISRMLNNRANVSPKTRAQCRSWITSPMRSLNP